MRLVSGFKLHPSPKQGSISTLDTDIVLYQSTKPYQEEDTKVNHDNANHC